MGESVAAKTRRNHRRSNRPGNSQVPVLYNVSTLESGTAVPTDGESRLKQHPTRMQGGKSLRFDDREGAFGHSVQETRMPF